jgi:hypothetical protein
MHIIIEIIPTTNVKPSKIIPAHIKVDSLKNLGDISLTKPQTNTKKNIPIINKGKIDVTSLKEGLRP